MSRRPITDAILAELAANPRRSAFEIAAAADSSPKTVRTVASQHSIKFGKAGAPQLLSDDNRAWLQTQAWASKCSIIDVLNAIVTDARCEAEGEA
ncbi:hypothetical protein N6L27_03570 [Leisingera sp. SS27]|uniref:hypothetical protein n=1 Tax=Leisingera sp. SS27 TaxID=2979462 RepID=UPI00232F58A6|nr:hypothetical protein [Leisingera sp. SS27]MDC0657069.1 hypothetical protein [Leisingera sp. SS27]